MSRNMATYSATISIHALREEGDTITATTQLRSSNFYPRPPRGGRRRIHPCIVQKSRFLSTPSARRATQAIGKTLPLKLFLSTPSARRATFGIPTGVANLQVFLSTPSARRATAKLYVMHKTTRQFLSTPSARRATAKTETKSLFSYKLYNILHEFRRALIYNGSKNYPNHAK